MPEPVRKAWQFGPYQLWWSPLELDRHGEQVAITPKALAVLAVLVDRHGSTVSKDELLDAVWPDTAVEEATLAQNVYLLRRLLARDFPDQLPIRTISKSGYRFDLPVEPAASVRGPSRASLPASADAGMSLPVEVTLGKGTQAESPAVMDTSLGYKAADAAHVRQSLWWGIAGLTVALFAIVLVARSGRFHRQPLLVASRFTSNSNDNRVSQVAISSDGRLVAYVDADGVVLRSIDNVINHALSSPRFREVSSIAWLPDQLHLLLSGESEEDGSKQVWKLSVLGDAPVLIRKGTHLAIPSHDGTQIAFTNGEDSEIWVMGSSGESPRRILSGGTSSRFPVVLWTNADDGLLVQRHTLAPELAALDTRPQRPTIGFRADYEHVDLGTGSVATLQADLPFGDACLTKNNDLLYSLSGPFQDKKASVLWRVPIDQISGAFRRRAEPVFYLSDDTHLYSFNCDASGTTVAAVRKQGNIGVYVGTVSEDKTQLSGVVRVSDDSDLAYPHGWSADSTAVFYEARRGTRWQIYRHSLGRHDPAPLTSMTGWQTAPRLTSDRGWLLFLSKDKPDGKDIMYRIPPNGGQPEQVPANQELKQFRCPQRKGSCIVGLRNGDGTTSYFSLDPISGVGAKLFTTPLPWGTPTDWDISPNGDEAIFSTAAPQSASLHRIDLHTARVEDLPYRPLTQVSAVNYANDGKGLLVATATSEGSDLYFVNRAGESRLLRKLDVATWAVPSPNGQKLAFVDRSLDSNVWLLHQE